MPGSGINPATLQSLARHYNQLSYATLCDSEPQVGQSWSVCFNLLDDILEKG